MKSNILLESGTNELEVVEFFLINETGEKNYYGINVAKVLEITRMPEKMHTAFGRQNSKIVGAFELRGQVLPLVSLSNCLNVVCHDKVNENQKVIITEFNNMQNGFVVSGVTRIHRINWDQIDSPSEILFESGGSCFTGTIKMDDRLIVMLDMENIIHEINPSLSLDFQNKKLKGSGNKKNIKLLFVDDSSTIRKTLFKGLEELGYDITLAINGKEAWNILSNKNGGNIQSKFDMVISDIEMPQMDGFTLTKNIKNSNELSKIPVILFSSLITDKILHKGNSVGADAQISKPDVAKLDNEINRLLAA